MQSGRYINTANANTKLYLCRPRTINVDDVGELTSMASNIGAMTAAMAPASRQAPPSTKAKIDSPKIIMATAGNAPVKARFFQVLYSNWRAARTSGHTFEKC